MKVKIKFLFMGLIIALTCNIANAQNGNMSFLDLTKLHGLWGNSAVNNAKEVAQDNELEKKEGVEAPTFGCNPLMLNGKTLDYGTFGLSSKGDLTIVKGKSEKGEDITIPFYVSIRRNGKVIENPKMPFCNKILYKVSLSDIFPFSQPDDVLIINPARAEDWQAKRILKILGGC